MRSTHGESLRIYRLFGSFQECRHIAAERIRIDCRTNIHTGQGSAADSKRPDNTAHIRLIMRQYRRITDFRLIFIYICVENFGCRRAGHFIRRDRRFHADADFGRRTDPRRDGYILQLLLAVRRDDEAFLLFLGSCEFSFFRRRFRIFRNFDGIALSGGRDIRPGNRRKRITGNRIHSNRRPDTDRRHAGRRG